jgi:hypothetical protein
MSSYPANLHWSRQCRDGITLLAVTGLISISIFNRASAVGHHAWHQHFAIPRVVNLIGEINIAVFKFNVNAVVESSAHDFLPFFNRDALSEVALEFTIGKHDPFATSLAASLAAFRYACVFGFNKIWRHAALIDPGFSFVDQGKSGGTMTRITKPPNVLNIHRPLVLPWDKIQVGQVSFDLTDPRSIGGNRNLIGVLGLGNDASCGATLPCSQTSIENDETEGDKRNEKFPLLVGAIFCALGFFSLYKVWWRVYFKLSTDSNVAVYVTLVFVSATIIWIGMALICFHLGPVIAP